MIHYHGVPITPDTAAYECLNAGHAFLSHRYRDQTALVVEVCQSFAIDNGAFSAWKNGTPVSDWSDYYQWAADMLRVPSCDFAVIPDVIEGSEDDNDRLIAEWPLPRWFGAPVWHMHESFERLRKLASEWPRVCIGSSGEFATVGNAAWWSRMGGAMHLLCDERGRPMCRLHGLRMLDPGVFTRLPFASADSTNVGRNIGIDSAWRGTYTPPTKAARARIMRDRIEAHNSPATVPEYMPEQMDILRVIA